MADRPPMPDEKMLEVLNKSFVRGRNPSVQLLGGQIVSFDRDAMSMRMSFGALAADPLGSARPGAALIRPPWQQPLLLSAALALRCGSVPPRLAAAVADPLTRLAAADARMLTEGTKKLDNGNGQVMGGFISAMMDVAVAQVIPIDP